MAKKPSNLVTVGRISTVFGVKGWVKVHSETEPRENIFKYSPWWLKTKHGVKTYEVEDYRPHGNGLIAHLQGIDERDQAEALGRVEIAIDRSQLVDLAEGDYYWSQLIGLRVVSEFGEQPQDIGVVSNMMETGANDVLVVVGDDLSIDRNQRLVPYVPEQFVLSVELEQGIIRVDWDPEF